MDVASDLLNSLACPSCELLSAPPPEMSDGFCCPRCGGIVWRRKPNSIQRTWALVIAATLFYLPANIFPILTVELMGKGEPDTIISGVIELINAGMWEIAALIFFASITVPVLKLVGLSYLLISVQRRSQFRPRERTRLYRLAEGIGRWSMIDMFMVSIVCALVQLGAIATINPGLGAICFATVVVITMFAASSFDPRLIWDAASANENQEDPK
jgi:paraquat-inducible protein A